MIRNFLLSLFLIFFSIQVVASPSSIECEDKISSVFSDNNSSKAYQAIKDKSFDEQIKYAIENFSACVMTDSSRDVAITSMSYLFGEAAVNAAHNVGKLLEKITNKPNPVDKEVMALRVQQMPINFLPEVLSVITYMISIACFLITCFLAVSMIHQVQSGKKVKYGSKTVIKSAVGFALIIPFEAFGGFSIIQYVFIFLVLIGVFFAKTIFIIFYLSIAEVNINQELNREATTDIYFFNSLKTSINNNVFMHLCDIQKREMILSKRSFSFNKKYSLLEQDSYYTCLNDPQTLDKARAYSWITDYTPNQIAIGQYCSQYIGEDPLNYCGNIPVNEDKVEVISQKLGVKNEQFQSILRSLAIQLRSYQCKTASKQFEYNGVFDCMVVDASGKYVKGVDDSIQMINGSFANEIQRDTELRNISDIYFQKISEYLKPRIKEAYVYAIMNNTEDAVKNEVKSIVDNIEIGFLNAGAVFFQKTGNVNYGGILFTENYQSMLKNAYMVDYDLNEHERLTFMEGVDERRKSLTSIQSMFDDVATFDARNQATTTIDFFALLRFITFDGQCDTDISKCEMAEPNQFLKLTMAGKDLLIYTTYMALAGQTFEMINNLSKKGMSNMASIFSTIGSLLNLNFLFAICMTYLIPAIPLLFFISLAFQWLWNVVKTFVVIQLVSLFFIMPNNEENLIGHDSKEAMVAKICLGTIIYPFMLMVCLISSFILANVGVSILNLMIAYLASFLDLSGHNGLTGLFMSVVGMFLYTVIVFFIVVKSAKAMNELLNKMKEWLGIEAEMNSVLSGLYGFVVSKMLPNLLNLKIFKL